MNKDNLIRKLYLKSLPPNILAVLGGTVNVLADSILVGRKLGETGLTAVNQSLTVYLLFCTLGSLIASGCAYKSAVAAGDNQIEEAQRYYKYALTYGVVLSVLVCLLGILCIHPVTRILSSEFTYEYVRKYLMVTILGGEFKVLLYIPFFYLRLEGKNVQSAITMTCMMVLNIILDIVFLFVCDFGITGAAAASVLATAAACILGFLFLHSGNSNFHLAFGFAGKEEIFDTFRYGIPMAFNNLLSAVRLLLLNLIFNRFAISEAPVIFAILNSMNEFLLCVQNGVPQTATAMTGIFFGEKDNKNLKNIVQIQMKTGLALTSFIAVLIVLGYQQIPVLFGNTIVNLFAFSCYAVSLVAGMICSILFYYYTSTGNVMLANAITFCRILLFAVIFCFLFSGNNLIWISFPLTEVATLATIFLMARSQGRKRGLEGILLTDPEIEKSGQAISYEVPCDTEAICQVSNEIGEFCEKNEFDAKKTMVVSLAIEEFLTIIDQKSLNGKGSMEIRVLSYAEECIVRIRSGGKYYNPVKMADDSMDYMGVRMIIKMSKRIDYQTTLGINTLIIHI